ncbi:MAG: SLC13 family permease [Candidatus Korarchaeum sp.]
MRRHYLVPILLAILFLIYFPMKNFTGLSNKQIQAVLIFIALFIMLAMEYRHRTVISLTTLVILWYLGIMSSENMIHYMDFDVLGLLFGMMVIVETLREAGFLSILARSLIKLGMTKFYQLVIVFSLLTFLLSAFLDNATVVLVMVPIALEVCEIFGLNPVPALITLNVSSNLGGVLTPVGDPPNIMISSHLGISFSDFIWNMAPVTLLAYLISLAFLMIVFRKQLRVNLESIRFEDGCGVKNRRLLLFSVPTVVLVILLFLLEDITGIRPASSAIYGAVFLLAVGGDSMPSILREVNWDLLIFLGSILIVSGALEKVGVLHIVAQVIFSSIQGNNLLLITWITWLSSFISAFVDNIPYTAVMIPTIDELVGLTGYDKLWWILVISVGLGGIATPIASVPSLVVYSVLREKFGFKFSDFMKIGVSILILLSSLANSYYVVLSFLT